MKSHRGLSAVIGTVFLIAVVVGALSYITYSIDVMGNFSEQLIAEESRQRDIQDEEFELVTIDIVSDKLDAIIKNTGEIPIKITTMYLDEMGDNTDTVQKISIDQTIAPGNSFDFFSESIDVDIDSTKGYSMKLVTSRGETQTFYLNSAGQESLDIQLIALPNRIPIGFSTTIMMVVVNNMSNNNPLVNLTPIEPACSGICTEIGDGPFPASYDILEAGDVAIFEWVYELDGDNDESVTFTSGLVGGVSGNTASETVTITPIQSSEIAGQSLESLGFGQTSTLGDLLVLHLEDYGIPSNADYQMHPTIPDDLGQNFIFDGTEDQLQWFSANATSDTTIAAGNWNASLRYNHDRLPSGMTDVNAKSIYNDVLIEGGKSDGGGGHTLHFNTDATIARQDSGTWSTCTSLVDSGSLVGATWGADIGVNGSGAYLFDGADDYISITNSGTKKECNYPDDGVMSIAGWFNSTAVDTSTRQYIFSKSGDEGGYNAWLGNSGSDGWMGFQFYDDGGDSINCWAENDYTDNNWHHFVGVKDTDTTCRLYVDGVLEDTSTNGNVGHEHEDDETIYIGAKDGTSNEFTGVIDDIMFWNYYALTASDVTALFEYSFGADATKLNIVLSNSTGLGVTDDVLSSSLSFGVPWSDQMDYSDLDGTWAGGNWTSGYLNEVGLSGDSPFGRLNFTIGYASGNPLTLRIDDSAINGVDTNAISSYLQSPPVDPELPIYHTYDNDNKVTFFAFNTAGGEGVWFTYQGSRIIFNGTGGHYTGIVNTVNNGVDQSTLSADTDSPFIGDNVQADIVFWHPQNIPSASIPSTQDKIPAGFYDVTIYLNGYDEDGTVFIRSIGVGTVLVVE